VNIIMKGTFLCSQAVGKVMIKQKYGKIVNIASISGYRGLPGQTAYCAAKAGVLNMTRQLAIEWGKYNIMVNSVSPGTTITPGSMCFLEQVGGTLEELERLTVLRRLNKGEDISNAVLFMASPEADNITGQDIVVDSGWISLYFPQ